jgi:hypothetical protein
MSYTNNIYIPFIESFHTEETFFFYKKYYESIGFKVNKLSYDYKNEINYFNIIEEVIKKEEILILIDYSVIAPFALHQSINLCLENKCVIKPSNKLYMVSDEDQINNIIDSIVKDKIVENFYYDSDMRYKVWPLDGAWVIHKDSFNISLENNKIISGPLGYDFDLCYKQYIFNNLIFVESDSYKFNSAKANIGEDVKFIYENYIESLTNIFGFSNNSYVYRNQVLEKIDGDYCKESIFNIKEYFSSERYI